MHFTAHYIDLSTLLTQEHAGVQIIIPRRHLHHAVEQDLHPQLTIATQVC